MLSTLVVWEEWPVKLREGLCGFVVCSSLDEWELEEEALALLSCWPRVYSRLITQKPAYTPKYILFLMIRHDPIPNLFYS